MLRLISFSLIIACVCASAAWLAAHPGQVTLRWSVWRIDTSAAFVCVLIVLLAFAMTIAVSLIRMIITSPRVWRRKKQERSYAAGLRAITGSMVALLEQNTKGAAKELKRAESHLGEAPITLLLRAQLARIEGNEAQSRASLEAMLGHKETLAIATKGLSEYHDRKEQAALALPHALRAFSMNPRDVRALKTLTSAHIRLGQWQEAVNAIKRAAFTIPRAERNHLLALVYYTQSHRLEAEGEFASAYTFSKNAVKYATDFIPAALLMAELADAHHEPAHCIKTLSNAWKATPHAQIATACIEHWKPLPPATALKAAEKFVRSHPNHEESHLLLAKIALSARAWDAARAHLKSALSLRESARACQLMAALETAQYMDSEATARWQARAANAEADAQWVCSTCATTTEKWQPHCSRCHNFDTLEWKHRSIAYAAA